MATPLNFGRDLQGYNTYAPAPSTVKWSATLTANTATEITVPQTYREWIVLFTVKLGADLGVWADFTGATAAVPAGATLATTTSELISQPTMRFLTNGTNISVISGADSTDISIQMWPVSYT